MKLQAGR